MNDAIDTIRTLLIGLLLLEAGLLVVGAILLNSIVFSGAGKFVAQLVRSRKGDRRPSPGHANRASGLDKLERFKEVRRWNAILIGVMLITGLLLWALNAMAI